MDKVYYIGQFGKGMGGVTVKNRNVFSFYESHIENIHKVDLTKVKHFSISNIVKVVSCLFAKRRILLGMSKNSRNRFLKMLYSFKKYNLKHCTVFIMGGTFHEDIKKDEKLKRCFLLCKHIFVETPIMVKSLVCQGFNNVSLLPNCRFKQNEDIVPTTNKNIKCLFFSLICPNKGVDLILEASKQLHDVSFDFYGPVVNDYKETFNDAIKEASNCEYRGVFTGGEDDKIRLLNQWDILLLPTRFITEGVPGIIVEAKMSAIVPVVSNFSNALFLLNDDSGIIMNENSADCLVEKIKQLCVDRESLLKMKRASLADTKRFTFDTYKDELLDVLK